MPRSAPSSPVLAAGVVALLLPLAAPRSAAAQATGAATASVESRRAAAEAAQNGQQRFLLHDYAGAASFFETANRLVPTAAAAQSAIIAHQRAGGVEHLATAATLALRAREQYPTDAQVGRLTTRVLGEASPQLGRISVQCSGCDVEVDSVLQSAPELFVPPGHHSVVGHFANGGTSTQEIDATAGQTSTVALEAPAAPAVASSGHAGDGSAGAGVGGGTHAIAPPSSGIRVLPPGVFIGGLVAAALLGGGWALSYIDAVQVGKKYTDNLDGDPATVMRLHQDADATQLRTNILMGATIGVGVLTLATGFLFTRWSAPRRVEVSAAASAGFTGVTLRGTF